MSSKDLLSPYINRFRAINQQMSYARLDSSLKLCVNIKKWLKISIIIWESYLDKIVDSDVLKKNTNTSQFTRLEGRAKTWAEEARVQTKKQQKIAAYENIEAEKVTTDTDEATIEVKEAKKNAEILNILLKKQRPYYFKPKRILKKL